MANLTLTAYNSQYSNLTFLEKRDMEKGFKESAFRLNNYLKSFDKWTEDELKERQKELLGVFMKLWPMPSTTFKPTKQEAESASLEDDDFEFTGKTASIYTVWSSIHGKHLERHVDSGMQSHFIEKTLYY